MKCSKCGNEVINSTICPNCGNQLVNQGVVNSTPSLNSINNNQISQTQTVQPQVQPIVQQPIQPVAQPQVVSTQPVIQPVAQPAQAQVPPTSQQPVQPVVQPQAAPVQPVIQPVIQTVAQPAQAQVPPTTQQPVQPVIQPQVAPVQPVQSQVQSIAQQPISVQQQAQPVQPNAQSQAFLHQMAANREFQSASIPLNAPVVTNLQPIAIPKKKNYLPLIIGISILLVAICSAMRLLQKDDNKKDLKENGTRTLMVYMIGSDLESDYGSATSDIEEIMESNFNEDDLNVLIYTGGTTEWNNDIISSDENAIYEVKNGDLNKVMTYDQKRMTDYTTLKEFISYVYDNYHTDLYDLVLWDHGGGPVLGYGQDSTDSSKSIMSISDLTTAIKSSSLGKETKLEYVGFDACLMSSVEIAYQLSDYAKYLVASEETIPGSGWNYSFLTDVSKDTKTRDLTQSIVDDYFTYYTELKEYYQKLGYKYDPGLTLAVTDLSKVENLVNNIDKLFANLDSEITVNNYSKVSQEFSRATLYGYQGTADTSYDLIDLYGLIEQLKDEYPDEAQSVLDAIKDTIYYENNNMDGSYGLSIYFPIKNKKYANYYYEKYEGIKFSENYKEYLSKYIDVSSNNTLVTSNSKSLLPMLSENTVSVELEDDLVENYDSAKYVIYRKLADNKYMVVNISSDVTLNDNLLSAQTNRQQLIAHTYLNSKPDESEPAWVTMIEQERTDEYAVYAIVSILERYDEENGLEMQPVYLMYKIENGQSKGEIIDVVEINSHDEASSKGGINLLDWQDIKFINYAYKLYDENGNFLDSAESYEDYYVNTTDITEDGIDLEFVSLDYDMNTSIVDIYGNNVDEKTDEYYYQFIVTDTQGKNHRTQLVKAS